MNKQPLLSKDDLVAIEMDIISEDEEFKRSNTVASNKKRNNLKNKNIQLINEKSKNKYDLVDPFEKDYYHSSHLHSQIFFNWVFRVLKVMLLKILIIEF